MSDYLYIGSYGPEHGGTGQGVTVVRRDPRTGRLSGPLSSFPADSTSYLAMHPDGHTLYAAHERSEGLVNALRTSESGELSLLNEAKTAGYGPCHLLVHPNRRQLLTAGYVSGRVCVLPLREDGSLDGAGETFTAVTGDALPRSHPHASAVLPGNGRIALTYLGLDCILTARLDSSTLVPDSVVVSPVRAGSGPRSLVLDEDGSAYTADELSSTVTRHAYDPVTAAFVPVVTASSTLRSPDIDNYPAEIQFAPVCGRIYVSNRGQDTITVLDTDDGLRPVAEVDAGGIWPQHFTVVDGYLYVACLESGLVTVFNIDPTTAIPGEVVQQLRIASPSCLVPDRRLGRLRRSAARGEGRGRSFVHVEPAGAGAALAGAA